MRLRPEFVFQKDIATKDFGAAAGRGGLQVGIQRLQCQPAEDRLVRVPDDMADARQDGEFVGSSLRITSRDNDASFRVSRRDPPDQLARFAVRFFSYCAGIHNDYACGKRRIRGRRSTIEQLLFDGSAFGLRSPAPEVRDKKTLGGHQPFGPSSDATFLLFSATLTSSFAL